MVFHTFGNKENSVAVLIHGMLTPWQIWGKTKIIVFKGYKHAELLCFKEDEWISVVQDWLKDNQV